MIQWETVLTLLLGSALTLLGTIVSNLLQYRAEARSYKRQRVQERFNSIREYLFSCLRIATLANILPTLDVDVRDQWQEELVKEIEASRALRITPTTWGLYVADAQVLGWSMDLEGTMQRFRDLITATQSGQDTVSAQELKELDVGLTRTTKRINQRLDELLDRI